MPNIGFWAVAGAGGVFNKFIAVASGNSGIDSWAWNNGFSTKLATPSPAINSGYDVAFTPNSTAIAVAKYGPTMPVAAYSWSASGPGSKFTDPVGAPGVSSTTGTGIAFNPAGNAVALATAGNGTDGSPYITAWPWSSGFGTKYANPATLPSSAAYATSFSAAGSELIVGHVNSPFVTAYPWSSGFGTKYANPATSPNTQINRVKFKSNENVVAFAGNSSPYVFAYAWSSAGFGSKFSNPGTLPTGTGKDVSFNSIANAIAISHSTAPFVTAYAWSSGFGTKYANPATSLPSQGDSVKFSAAGDLIFIGTDSTPYIHAYAWSSGFGTKYANPAVLGDSALAIDLSGM